MEIVRADQIGSLLRPAELIQAWGRLFAGQLAPEQLAEVEDRAIEAALEQQRRTGIGIYTDGEFRRIVYLTSLAQAVDGFAMGQGDRLPWKDRTRCATRDGGVYAARRHRAPATEVQGVGRRVGVHA